MFAIPPLAAESIFHIGSFPVTNSYINSTIALLLFLITGFVLRRRIEEIPRGFQNFMESVLEYLLKYFDQITGSRQKSLKFLPMVGSLFFFILISNWMGILPGIGSIGIWELKHGERELIPLFRPAMTDLNLTLAMAVVGVIFSHLVGVVTIGFFRYANKFIKFGDIWNAVKTGKPMKMMIAVIEFFVGLIEVISELAKLASLSLRLFGNIFAGEVLMTVIGGLVAFFVPLPFIALEILVGVIQAAVFSMLVLVYLTVATMELHEAH
ncbi:MAG: F0F1 ATP synthase subunit A [bacterium]|nr:F0F1 ATP synthase subunit A [bacterium]